MCSFYFYYTHFSSVCQEADRRFFRFCCLEAIPHKERLATLHAICLQISRHISQKCSWIHQVFTPLFVSSDEKFDDASVAQSLCGIALTIFGRVCYNHKQSALERVHILYSAVESCSRKGVIAMTWMEFLTLCNVVCDIILILQNSNKRK